MMILITFIIVLGMFLESTVIVLLLTPILMLTINRLGIDPVHFGLVMMTCVTFGGMTPPVGVAMFAVCGARNTDAIIRERHHPQRHTPWPDHVLFAPTGIYAS